MRIFVTGAALLGGVALVFGAASVVAADSTDIARPNAQAMSTSEIKAFNAKLPTDHRYFITCRRSTVTGSYAKINRTCQTREDWERIANDAQNETNETINRARVRPGCAPFCD